MFMDTTHRLENGTDLLPLQYEYDGQVCRRVLDRLYMMGLMRTHKSAFVILDDDCGLLGPQEQRGAWMYVFAVNIFPHMYMCMPGTVWLTAFVHM